LDSLTRVRAIRNPGMPYFGMPGRRQLAWLAPLVAAIVAGGIVAGFSFGGSTHRSAVAAAPVVAGRPAQSFQEALVRGGKAGSPSVVQIEDSIGRGSSVVRVDGV